MVYFALAADTGNVKIGFTSGDPRARVAALSTGCPSDLILLHAMVGDKAAEVALHLRFAASHVRGEWFRLRGDLASHLADLLIEAIDLVDSWNPRPWIAPPQFVTLDAIDEELGRGNNSGGTLWEIEGEYGFEGGTAMARTSAWTPSSMDFPAIAGKLCDLAFYEVVAIRNVWRFPTFLTAAQCDRIVWRLSHG